MANFEKFDAIAEKSTTSGTGTVMLAGSVGGTFRTFASKYSNGNKLVAFRRNGASLGGATKWERWAGTFSSAGAGSISKDTLIDSSTGNWINWTTEQTVVEVSPNPKEIVEAGSNVTVTRNPATGAFIVSSSDADDQTAAEVPFTPAGTIAATNVQAAIEELAGDVVALVNPGADCKTSVRLATTANITLSGEQTIDGVAVVAGERVLVKDQTTGSENGIYVVSAGAWTRATDADGSAEVTAGLVVIATEGTANADTLWELSTNDPITLGSTSLVFIRFNGLVTSVFGQVGAVVENQFRLNTLTEDLTPNAAADFVMTWDTSDGAPKKVLLDNLPGAYTDDDVITLLSDVLEDGYGINWNVFADSLGTHFQPDRIVTLATDSYAADITIDLAATTGELHRFTLTGNPTLTLTNFEHNDPGEPGKQFTLNPVQDATGGRTINFSGSSQTWVFPDGEPALTSIPSGEDFLVFRVEDVSPATFRFMRAIHRPRRIDFTCGTGGVEITPDAHWLLDEASGTRADQTATYSLTEYGGSTGSAAGKIGNAAQMKTGRYLRNTNNVLNQCDRNFSVWMWVNLTSTSYRTLAQQTSAWRVEQGLGGVNRLTFSVESSLGTVTVSADTFGATPTSTWCFVAASFDVATKTLSISVNAGTADTANMTGTPATNGSATILDLAGNTGDLLDDVAVVPKVLTTADISFVYNSGSGTSDPFGAGPVTLDWRRELNYVTLQVESGTFTINTGDVLPSQTIRLAVENSGATGTLTLSGVDFGDEGNPTLPATGKYDLFELTAIDATTISGRTLQTGLTP